MTDVPRGTRSHRNGEHELIVLEGDGCRAIVDPAAGGRLTSFSLDGWERLLLHGPSTFRWGNFVMAPFVGRLRHGILRYQGSEHQFPRNAPPHALFGLVTERPWERVGLASVTVDLATPWPWRGRVTQSFRLESGCLEARLELSADEPMPASMGWHPWFARVISGPDGRSAGQVELDVEPGLMYANDDEGIPNGELVPPTGRPWDNCFRELASPPRLLWPGQFELTVESNCTEWVIYEHDERGICIEPWTAPPNALNTASARRVTPDAPLVATMRWTWRRLS